MANINVNYSPYRSTLRSERAAAKHAAKAVALENSNEVIKIDISPSFLIIGMFASILLLGGLFLMNSNKSVTSGYQLKRLEISQQELKDQNDVQNLYLAKAKSLNYMEGTGKMDSMRAPNNVQFVYGENVIAKAN
jgi:hypothetical protein